MDDERLVFSVVDLQSGSGEDYLTAPGLFAAKYDGSELRRLIEREGRAFIQGADDRHRARSLDWNHTLLHVPVAGEEKRGAQADEGIVGKLSGNGSELTGVQPLWLNTRTGATRNFDTFGHPGQVVQWWFTLRGEPRLVLTRAKGWLAYHWFTSDGLGSGSWKQIAEGTLLSPPPAPAWVGADALYLRQPMGPAGEAYVVDFDFVKGAPGDQPLVRTPGFDFAGSFLSSREGRLLGVRVDTDAMTTIWFDAARKALQQSVDAAFPGSCCF